MANFVFTGEMIYFVESIRPFQVKEVGSPKWFECHEIIIKLSQQAILEASEHREEEVKELIISKDKLKTLIHEAYCVLLWKTRVLPHLLEIDPNPQATFLIYTIFFHEGAVVSLLDIALFHESGCQALQDSAIDLVDYCAQGIAQLIGLTSMTPNDNATKYDANEGTLAELDRQKRDFIFKIGLRCISIMNYLADNVNALPLSAGRRMVVTHDVPWLMADLLHFRPWQKHTKNGMSKYIDEKWTNVQGDLLTKVVKYEAQSWFCLRQLLFNTALMESYEINEDRRMQFVKCEGLLHEAVLDQLPPLVELKQLLCHMILHAAHGARKSKSSNLLMEELPQIRENLVFQSKKSGGFLRIAQQQEQIFLCTDKKQILDMAQILNIAYNTELLAEIEAKKEAKKVNARNAEKHGKKCSNCLWAAMMKCSNCKTVYYCSKKCQLNDWPKHKKDCIKA